MPKASRPPLSTIPNHPRFVAVREQGISVSTKSLLVQSAPSQLDEARIGLTVTKKIGHAVTRNRIKRRLRVLLRTPSLYKLLEPGYDYVLIARHHITSRDFTGIEKDLRYALHELKRCNNM